MSIDRHHILKTSKKFDKLDITVLNNSNIFKENNTDGCNSNTKDEDFNIPLPSSKTVKNKK